MTRHDILSVLLLLLCKTRCGAVQFGAVHSVPDSERRVILCPFEFDFDFDSHILSFLGR